MIVYMLATVIVCSGCGFHYSKIPDFTYDSLLVALMEVKLWYSIPQYSYAWQGNTSPPQHKGIQWGVVFGGGAYKYINDESVYCGWAKYSGEYRYGWQRNTSFTLNIKYSVFIGTAVFGNVASTSTSVTFLRWLLTFLQVVGHVRGLVPQDLVIGPVTILSPKMMSTSTSIMHGIILLIEME